MSLLCVTSLLRGGRLSLCLSLLPSLPLPHQTNYPPHPPPPSSLYRTMPGYDIKGKICLVTGGGNGIGEAICLALAQAGAAHVVVLDIDVPGAQRVAKAIGDRFTTCKATAKKCDVSVEGDIRKAIVQTENFIGPVGLFVANAGIGVTLSGPELSNGEWDTIMKVNVMQIVYAARHLVPLMTKRGGGGFLVTASAAGLLTQIGDMAYAVTKHAAVSAAEWLAITYGPLGIHVSCLCPQAVRTDMTKMIKGGGVAGVDGMLEPEEVAAEAVAAVQKGDFLVLPHKSVTKYIQRKAADYDRWIGGMQRLQERYMAAPGKAKL
eukprot:Sspe_Gene.47728::Locus_24486_Transcript_1_1_Confidence_1.000_Length_1306::g.47728::m.47728